MLGFHLGGTLRGDALGYAVLIAAAGAWTHRSGIKRHFLETYLHVAANAALAALVSGVLAGDRRTRWLMLLLLACGAIIDRGVRARRFVFVSYGVIYGYVGLSARVLGFAPGLSSVFLYFVVSGTIVIGSLALLSRRFHRDS
jgi:hypothetical protein